MISHLTLIGLLYVTFCVSYRWRKGEGLCAACPIGLVLVLLTAAPAVIWIVFLALMSTVAVCWCLNIRASRFAGFACIATIVIYALAIAGYYPRHREATELRAEYLPIPIADRLKYESRIIPFSSSTASYDVEHLEQPIAGELERFERSLNAATGRAGHLREGALRKLYFTHSNIVDAFTQSQGFGVVRTRPLPPAEHRYIDLPELPLVAYPNPVEAIDTASLDEPDAQKERTERVSDAPRAVPSETVLRDFHEFSAVDFANPAGFGFVFKREVGLGFQSHGFREMPALPADDGRHVSWQITRIELVSLLKHEPAAAYLSQNLPRMDELVDATTRPLDAFESQALGKLRDGEEIVVENGRDELRMVGSLRAARQCIECHSVKRGDLLGAFTYRLQREGTVRRKPAQSDKPVL